MEREPFKIGFVLDDSLDPPDGVQQYVLTLGAWLGSQGHSIHYLAGHTTRTDLINLHSLARNQAVSFNGNRMRVPLPVCTRTIQALLAHEQFDILHIQMPYSPFLAGALVHAASLQTAVVGTFHIVPDSVLVRWASAGLALWCRRTLQRFDAVASVSPAAQSFAKRTFGITSTVVPNAIELERFRRPEPVHRPGRNTLHIVFLGRLVPRKGCLLLLQAIDALTHMTDVPPFHVSICGQGPLANRLKRFVIRRHLTPVVTFVGFISEDDKPAWLASADITVFPSSGGESFGIVLVEAMASGRSAVIAGDNAGYRSILADCPATVLFDPFNPIKLATSLLALLSDRAMRQQIARWQTERVQQYDVSQVGRQLAAIYRSALQCRRELR